MYISFYSVSLKIKVFQLIVGIHFNIGLGNILEYVIDRMNNIRQVSPGNYF